MHRSLLRTILSLVAAGAAHAVMAGYTYEVATNDTVVSIRHVAAEKTQDALYEVFRSPDVSRVEIDMQNNVLRLVPGGSEPATYPDGTIVKYAQLRIARPGAVGPGPISIGSGKDTASMLVAEASMTVPNQLVFSNDNAWVTGSGQDIRLTVNRLAARQGGHAARFGRQNNDSQIHLDLADDELNEPLYAMVFRGRLTGTLGGVVKISKQGKSPFLRNGEPVHAQSLSIVDAGVVLDAEEGADVLLTQDVALENSARFETELLASATVPNAGFEDGNTGWSAKKVDSNSSDNVPGVKLNTDATWVGSRPSPFGDRVMVLRTGHLLTGPEITIPSDGVWRLNFWRVGRPGYSAWDRGTEVAFENLDTHETATCTVDPMAKDVSEYVQTCSPGLFLAAGRYRFSLHLAPKNTTAAMLYDNFAVESVNEKRVPGATVAKRGPGRVLMPATAFENAFAVAAGELAFDGATFGTARADVAAGGVLEIAGGCAVGTDAVVSVASGATLRLADLGTNIVQNGSFERNILAPGVNFMNSNTPCDDWRLSCVTPNSQNGSGGNNGGVQGNGGNITASGPYTTAGSYTAAIREHCQLSQTVQVPEEGDYVLSFVYAMRKAYGSTTAGRVLLDDEPVGPELPRNDRAFTRVDVKLHLAAGAHPLAFHVHAGASTAGGPMMLVDDVSLRRVKTPPVLAGALNLASGSVLDLRNTEPLEVSGPVTVDGVPFRGGRAALARRGVVLLGEGEIQVGQPIGTVLLLR